MSRYRYVSLLCLLLLAAVSCKNNRSFDKTRYLDSCGISLDEILLSDIEEDSLLYRVFSPDNSPNIHFRNELVYEGKVQSGKELLSILYDHISSLIYHPTYIDTLLFAHYYATGITKCSSPEDIVGLTLSYAKIQDRNTKVLIGENSFEVAQYISDSLAYASLNLILSGITGSAFGSSFIGKENIDITNNDLKKLFYWSKIGLQYAQTIYGHESRDNRQWLEHLTDCSWRLKSPQFDTYADSLFSYLYRHGKPDFFFGNMFYGALYGRYIELLISKEYERAECMLDFFCPSVEETDSIYISLKNILPERQRRDYHAPVLPESSNLELAVSKLDRDLIWLILDGVGNEGIVDRSTMCFFEKARMAYLKEGLDYSTWLNRAFYEGVYKAFPSSSHEFLDNYIRPEHQFNQGLINLLTLQYNNASPESVYDALLFIKGASETIPPSIYNCIKDKAPNNIIEYVDSIRAFGIKSRLGWERDYLENEIGPNIKGVLSKSITSYMDIRERIGEDSAAIEFYAVPSFVLDENFFYRAAILTSDNEKPLIVDLCSGDRMREILLNKSLYVSNEAYSTIWAPIEKYIADKGTIYFSMDRLLNVLNLQALLMPDGNRLSQKCNLIQLTSTKDNLLDKTNQSYKSIALFGGIDYNTYSTGFDSNKRKQASPVTVNRSVLRSFKRDDFSPLPFSQIEIDEIANCAARNNLAIQYFSASDGTEDAFKQLSGHQLSILHIATHGFYYSKNQAKEVDYFKVLNDTDNPLERCGLLLAGSQRAWRHPNSLQSREDGILLGEEIAKLDFSNVDLIVLSACKSALGDISSEGVVGLKQAFKRAGAKSILITLNNIDDKATAYFMSLFYNHLFETGNKYDSFDFAINGMKSSKEFSDPSYWAHFVLID